MEPFAPIAQSAFLGGRSTRRSTDAKVATAAGGELEQSGDSSRAQVPPRLAEREVHGRRQGRLDLRLGDREVADLDLRIVDLDRQPDGLSLEARERTDDRGRRCCAVELLATTAVDDLRRPSM
jgi:hypothetical protein